MIPKPSNCDICSCEIEKSFVDGKTKQGPWANMCLVCHRKHGIGLGTGKGQMYEKKSDGSFVKVASSQ